jgi:hypothetical protein
MAATDVNDGRPAAAARVKRAGPIALLAVVATALACGPAEARAKRTLAPPSVDAKVTRGGRVPDRVLSGSAATGRAATAGTRAFKTADGYTIAVQVSSAYAADTSAVQRYVDFLGSLPHGSELGTLRLVVATPSEVAAACGDTEGVVLACYAPSQRTMVVPGEQPANTGLSVEYIVAHEYAHHVAASRDNAPFDALDWGPKYWASYEHVCAGVAAKRYFPGDEGTKYLSNPGENWAEVYAHLVYPSVPWTYDPSLQPNTAAFAAARRDVTAPWTGRRTKRFKGSLSAGSKSRSFRFELTLDGSLSLRVAGPRRANYDLAVYAGGRKQGSTSASKASDALTFSTACLTKSSEIVTVRVLRRSGSGAFSLSAKYAG